MSLPDTLRRPLVERPERGPWVIMLFAIYWGYASYERNFNPDWIGLTWNPGNNLGANVRTYRYAAELAREGRSFYGVAPPGLSDWAIYLYPPITVVAYYPFTVVEWMSGYWFIVAANAAAGVAVAAVIVVFIERAGCKLGWFDVALIVGLLLLSPFTFGTIYYGNINLLIALAFVVGFLAVERDRSTLAGTVFGIVALFKLFPAIVGAWLIGRRSWRAIASATAVGIGGLIAGIVVYGREPTVTFFTDVLLGRTETARFVGGYPADGTYYVTIQRPLSHVLWNVFPTAPPELLTLLTLLVACGVLVAFYRTMETLQERLVAFFATMVVTITLVPALQWYLVFLYFPMVPLWYLWEGPGRLPFLAGGAILFVNVHPGSLVDGIGEQGFPHLLEFLLLNLASFATIQLYGIALMLTACAMSTTGLRPFEAVARAGEGIRAVGRSGEER